MIEALREKIEALTIAKEYENYSHAAGGAYARECVLAKEEAAYAKLAARAMERFALVWRCSLCHKREGSAGGGVETPKESLEDPWEEVKTV